MTYKIYGQGADSSTTVDYQTMLERINSINDKSKNFTENSNRLVEILGRERISKFTVNLVRTLPNEDILISNGEASTEVADGYVNYSFSKIVWLADPQSFPQEEKKGKLVKNYNTIFSVATTILKVNDLSTTPEIINSSGRNTFKLGIYEEYLKQLQAFLNGLKNKYPLVFNPDKSPKNDFCNEVIFLVNYITDVKTTNRSNHLNAHKEILITLRSLLERYSKTEPSPIVDQAKSLLEELVLWMYTQVQLENVNKDVFQRHALPALSDMLSRSFEELFIDVPNRLLKLLNFYHYPSIDRHTLGYLPHPMFKVQHSSECSTEMIYSASPIYSEVNKPDGLQSEYLFLIEGFQRSGKRLLHVNLMLHPDETSKTIVINSELKKFPNVKVLGLNRFSLLFMSRNVFSTNGNECIHNWSIFKQVLLDQWFNDSIGHSEACHFINEENLEGFKTDVSSLLEAVKQHYFRDDATLGDYARRFLQDLAFVEMIEYEMAKHKYDYCTIACNSSADRAPSLYTLLRLKQILRRNPKLGPEEKRELVYSLFVPAFIHENRQPHQDRINDFIEEALIMIAAGPMPTFVKPKIEPKKEEAYGSPA